MKKWNIYYETDLDSNNVVVEAETADEAMDLVIQTDDYETDEIEFIEAVEVR